MSLTLPQSVLDQARAAHEANMPDRCDIDMVTYEWDEAAQESLETVTPVYKALRCRVPAPSSGQRVILTGETVTPVTALVRVPVDAVGIAEDARVTITSAANDPELVGTVLWVSHNRVRTYATARYLECREIR